MRQSQRKELEPRVGTRFLGVREGSSRADAGQDQGWDRAGTKLGVGQDLDSSHEGTKQKLGLERDGHRKTESMGIEQPLSYCCCWA